MKFLVVLAVFVVAAQAKAVNGGAGLKFINKYVDPVSPVGAHDGGAGEPRARIISGLGVTQGTLPWQALITMDLTNVCSGVLVSELWVISAAHCLTGYSSYEIVLGGTTTSGLETNTVTQNVRKAFHHANYDAKTLANDIGFVGLPRSVIFTSYIKPVRLPSISQMSSTFVGTKALVSGYGRYRISSQLESSLLLTADVTVISNDVCAQTFGSSVESTNICTKGINGERPCGSGDSGGPLVIVEEDRKTTLIGIASFFVNDCPADSPAAYARVTSYLEWISKTTGVALRP